MEHGDGLNRFICRVPGVGTIYVNFPDDVAAGDVFTGTIFAEPDGKGDERDKNLKALQKFVVEVGTRKSSVSEKTFEIVLPPTSKATRIPVQLLDSAGEIVGHEDCPIRTHQPQPPKEGSLPPYGQVGQIFTVACLCDGVLAETDYLKVGGKQILILAESARKRVALNTSEAPGPTQIEISERGQITKGEFRNISLKMTASKLKLDRGEQATMRIEVHGLENLKEEIPLRLTNRTMSVLSMGGGNVQSLTIRPRDVQAGGVYTTERTLTGISIGAFLIDGVITWKNLETSEGSQTLASVQAQPSNAGLAFHDPISFVEEEEFTISDDIVKAMGYKLLKVSPGAYQVQFDASHQFGYVLLNLKKVQKSENLSAIPPNGFGPHIRIARRPDCAGGIGFRCGLVPHRIGISGDGLGGYAVTMHVEGDKRLRIEFQQSVPWDKLKQGASQ